MKKFSISVAVALLVFSFLAMQTFAVEGGKAGHGEKFTGMRDANKVSDITGATVMNRQGEDLGTVHDLIVSEDGRVKYMILSHGGVLGVGDKLIPVPWRAVSAGTKENTFLIDMDKDKLANAPSFDRNNWPNFADPGYGERVFSYYGLSSTRGTDAGNSGMEGATPESSGSRTNMDSSGQHKSMQPRGTDMNK